MEAKPSHVDDTSWPRALRRGLLVEPVKAFAAEVAKCRRTWIFLLALAPGAGLAGLKVLGFFLRGAGSLGPERYTSAFFLSIGAGLWDQLVLPFLAVSAAAWTAWVENDNEAWKLNFVQPVSRGAVFTSKFLLAAGLLALVELSWALFHLAGGWLLQLPGPSLHDRLFPHAGLTIVSLAPMLALQHWIAYRSRGLALPLIAGLSGIVVGMVMSSKSWAPLLPWAYPSLAGTHVAEALAMTAFIFGLGLLSCSGLTARTRRRPATKPASRGAGRPADGSDRLAVASNPPLAAGLRQAGPKPHWMRLMQAEWLKLRRSAAVKAALLAPLLFSALVTIDFMTRPSIQEGGLATWATYFQTIRALWGVFGCALLAAVLAALWMGVEHHNDNWTLLFTQPLRAGGIVRTKLAAVAGLATVSTGLLFLSAMGGGVLAGLSGPFPWSEAAITGTALTALLPVVLLQCGLSLKARSFLLPVGLGLMAHFLSAVAANVAILGIRPGYYSPWAILLRALQVGGAERAAGAFDLAVAGLLALGLLLLVPRLRPAGH